MNSVTPHEWTEAERDQLRRHQAARAEAEPADWTPLLCEFDDEEPCNAEGSVTVHCEGSDSLDAWLFLCPPHAAELTALDPDWQPQA